MKNTAKKNYQKAVVSNFNFLKAAKTIQDVYLRAISIEGGGYLLPVSECHLNDHVLLANLTNWRNTNVSVYPTQFVATQESTRIWLKDRLLSVSDRILFLVVDDVGEVIGHLGFNGCLNAEMMFELDNVVRGVIKKAKEYFHGQYYAL